MILSLLRDVEVIAAELNKLVPVLDTKTRPSGGLIKWRLKGEDAYINVMIASQSRDALHISIHKETGDEVHRRFMFAVSASMPSADVAHFIVDRARRVLSSSVLLLLDADDHSAVANKIRERARLRW